LIELRLEMLEGRAKRARVNVEIEAIEKLLFTKEEVLKKLWELKASTRERWVRIKNRSRIKNHRARKVGKVA